MHEIAGVREFHVYVWHHNKKGVLAGKSDNHVLYRVTSQIWQLLHAIRNGHRQDQWEGSNYVVPFEGGGSPLFYNVFRT